MWGDGAGHDHVARSHVHKMTLNFLYLIRHLSPLIKGGVSTPYLLVISPRNLPIRGGVVFSWWRPNLRSLMGVFLKQESPPNVRPKGSEKGG